MNYAALINGSFSGNKNNHNNNSRSGYIPNSHGPKMEITGQHPSMIPNQSFNSGTGQPLHVYRQFSSASTTNDPRMNIHIGSKLFVGQVPAMTTEEQLRPIFEPYGVLLEVKIMRDSVGRSKGSAWVRYETNEMAMSAIHALHEKHIVPPQTNPLRVQFATPNTGRHYYHQAQQQVQQHPRYSVELRDSVNQYNIGGSMIGGTQKGGMVMLRSGTSPNAVSPIPPDGGGSRYVSSGYGGSGCGGDSLETLFVAAGPYTSSANRFHNVSAPGSRRDVYSPFEHTKLSAPQLYSQQRGGFPPSLSSPPSMYNQPSPSQLTMARNAYNIKESGGVNVGTFDAEYAVGDLSDNVTATMPTD